ncbi:MAG: SIR2 family protein [Gemmatimonadaceae bacterium]
MHAERQEEGWTRLRKAYAKGLALGLGAGVSKDSKMPSWADLLVRLSKDGPHKSGDLSATVEELIAAGMGLPAIGAVLAARYADPKSFVKALRKALYAEFEFFPTGGDETGLVKLVQKDNPTLRAVSALCAQVGGDKPYVPNPLIKSIINFNIDQLLQKYTENRYKNSLLRTIERASASPDATRIPTYHVHGFLRFDRKAGRSDKESDVVVFTEQDYFEAFNSPTSIFTYTVLHLLREHTFLFVGLSMNDQNLRRLLHFSQAEMLRSHEAERKSQARLAKRAVPRHFAIMPEPSTKLREAKATSLAKLGVECLWVADFKKEIPARLGELYESAGGRWTDVY